MRKASLVRDWSPDTSKTGTLGRYKSDSGFECDILERPGSGDHPCIPAGVYQVKLMPHPSHGLCYELQDVPGRTAILIHSANWFQQLLGCLAPGRSIQQVIDETGKWLGKPGASQVGVTSSLDALKALTADMAGEAFQLSISQALPPGTSTGAAS